jgi:hypothetical protein
MRSASQVAGIIGAAEFRVNQQELAEIEQFRTVQPVR